LTTTTNLSTPTVFSVVVGDSADEGTVCLFAGGAIEDGMVVEARMLVIQHPDRVIGATQFVGFTEFRVKDAIRVGK
jgi:hypothetical protein